jgi:2'-hydroxyisoflavone reductase
MTHDRREFLKASALMGGALGLGLVPSLASAETPKATAPARDGVEPAPAPLKILILGGTAFLGPEQVEYAVARGHTVSIFNRGKTNPGLFPSVEKLIGDRNAPNGYASLGGNREWDVVIDIPTTLPSWVRGAADALVGRTKHYIFVSTISVFSDYTAVGIDENGPLHEPGNPDATERGEGSNGYGPLKVRSELTARERFGAENVTIVRPGLIVGPGDPSDRFTYWPARIDRGGEIMAPGTPNDPTQYVDVRDLSQWIIRLAEQRVIGTFNATGPRTPTTMAELLYGIKAVTTSDARFTWVDADFLAAQKVPGWSEMPVWAAPRGGMTGFMQIDCSKAYAAGLTFRPLAETAHDTLVWHRARPAAERDKMRAGIAAEKERTVLAAFHARGATGGR